MYKILFIILLLTANINSLFSQGRINLMSGKTIEGTNIEVSKGLVHYDFLLDEDKDKHPKVGEAFEDHEHSHGQIEIYRVFSITDSVNVERVLYAQDSTHGRHYSEAEMRNFISGEKLAYKLFKSPATTVITGVIGIGNGLLFSTVSPILALPGAFITAFVASAIPARVKSDQVENQEAVKDPAFHDGYKRVAKSKKLRGSMLSSVAGTAIGLVTGIIIAQQ